jgi:transcriptional regulator with XRE-family HTH domain
MDIKGLRLKFGLTQAALAELTGIPKGRINGWEQQGTKPKSEDFLSLSRVFETLENEYSQKNIDNKKTKIIPVGKHVPMRIREEEFGGAYPDWEGIPMYNVPITASFVESYRDESIYTPMYYLRDPRFRDCDFGAVISGDSMHSEIRHGDFVACKRITDTRFLVYGDIYYIVASNGLETCKYINAGKDEGEIMLHAKNEKISPSPLPKDMIMAIYKVRGIIRTY